MGENHGGRGFENEGHFWKAKAMEYRGRYEQEQRSRRLIETDYEILNKDLIESRKEIVKLRGTVERLNSLTVQNSLELANYRSGCAEMSAAIRNLRETNEQLLRRREGFQQVQALSMTPHPNQVGLVSPARSINESISNSTISSCNCPNCSPYLYTPSTVNSSGESGFRSVGDRVVCPVCCYHIKNPNYE